MKNCDVSVHDEFNNRLNTGLIKDFSIPEKRDDVNEDKLSPYNVSQFRLENIL